MTIRPCLTCGKPTEGNRCAAHARGTTAQRGYGAAHQAERKAWTPLVAAGNVLCRRCRQPIKPDETWHLGHPDRACSRPKAPEHEDCNVGKRPRGAVESRGERPNP